MLRVVLTIIVPLVVPTGLYLFWVLVLRPERRGRAMRWSALPWLWLAGAGARRYRISLREGHPLCGDRWADAGRG